MVREALLGSDRFLSLPDNTARMCFVVCLLTADDRGNMEASPGQLVRLWRDFGIDSNAKAAAVSQALVDQDLIRMYEDSGKTLIHVPRFKQRKRHLVRACPSSPWDHQEESPIEQSTDRENDGRPSVGRQTIVRRPSAEVKGKEVKRSSTSPNGEVAKAGSLTPACPHDAIIDSYHRALPMAREVIAAWSGTRRKHLQARWRESPKHQSLAFWDELFAYIAQSPFLTGRTPPTAGRAPFQLALEWIVKPDSFQKIIEGAYHRDLERTSR
jgi:hypothetical protein